MLEKFKMPDIVYKNTIANCEILYHEVLCDILYFYKDIYPNISNRQFDLLDEITPGICRKIKEDEIEGLLFSGLLIAKRNFELYAYDLAKPPTRGVSDSIIEPESAFSSRDGFVESFKINLALIRTRIKDPKLDIIKFDVGRRSKTIVSLLYIKDIHNLKIKKEIENVINSIDTDAITSLSDVTSYFQRGSLFPSYQYIGSPDVACKRLLDGEFILVIDRISCVVGIPSTLWMATNMPIENMNISIFTFLEKMLVVLSVFLSTIFLGIICAFTTIQSDSLSLQQLSILKVTQRGIIVPVFFEILIVLSLFELFYLIGFRQTKATISSTIVLIAGLIIGENLINSGFASVFIITMTAVCFLTTFIVSANSTTIVSISIIRFFVLLSSFYFGLYGVFLASIFVIYLVYKEKPLGVNFFYPFIPFDIHGIFKFFTSPSSLKFKTRHIEYKINNVFKRGKK